MNLLTWVSRLFSSKTRSTTGSLTEWERLYVEKHAMCPDCESGKLLMGPEGGASMNVKCNEPACGSRFNLTEFFGKLAFAERI